MALLYETSILGMAVKVFSDRIEYKAGIGSGVESIPISQIASIKLGSWMMNRMTIETSGGREYVIVTGKKKEVADAIYQAQAALRISSSDSAPTSIADELSKLATLRNQGVLTEQEFELQKSRLIGHGQDLRPTPVPASTKSATPSSLATRKGSGIAHKLKMLSLGVIALFVVLIVIAMVVGPTKHDSANNTQDSRPAPMNNAFNTGNKANDMLLAMNESARVSSLAAIVEEGCEGTKAFYAGISKKDHGAFWDIGCASGASYRVRVAADDAGSATVLNCLVLKAVADTDCFASIDNQSKHSPRTRKQIQADIDRLPPAVKQQAMRQLEQNIRDAANQ